MEIIFPREFDCLEFEKYLESLHPSLEKGEKYLKKKINDVDYIFNYKDKKITQAIWEMKFRSNKKVAIIFGKFLKDRILKVCGNEINFLLVPTPIHKKRREERGFNQCEWLCEEIIKSFKKGISNKDGLLKIKYQKKILIREKYTTKQSWSNKKDREKNLKGVFVVPEKFKEEIKNTKIILIDDVLTTGSTIREMHRTLIESGASKIISIVIAH